MLCSFETAMLSALIVSLTATAASSPCGWPAANAYCNGPSAKFEHGIGYPHAGGGKGPMTTSEVQCCCACAEQEDCNGWTLNGKEKTCYLKTSAGPSTAVKSSSSTVSGLMPARPPPPPYKPLYPTPRGARNILFLVVDDMRPSIGAYNFTLPGQPTHTPNIDKLASEGLVFNRAYVQYAFCSPSRNSFMTGRRPDTTGVWEFTDHFREIGVGDEWVTLPQYFKQFGYLVLGGGKLYHPASATENVGMPDNDYPESWSPEYPYVLPKENSPICAAQGPFPAPAGSPARKGYVWCEVDVKQEDSVLYDQQSRDACINHLKIAKNATTFDSDAASRPFFVGCGHHKPHAPHYAPKEFYERLPPWDQVPLPLDPFAPVGMPAVAWHPYADVSGMAENPSFNGTVNMTRLALYRRAYYASVSYQDANIGAEIAALDELGLKNSTVVVLFGDHGYQLGEHDTWAKMTNFELGVHIPLIIRVPWMTASIGKRTNVLAELVDIYPTLAELAGLPNPRLVVGSESINGTSLAPVFISPSNTSIKKAAFSQFAKDNIGTSVNCHFTRNQTQMMGYSIRTDQWRYTAWFKFNTTGAGWGPHFGTIVVDDVLGVELYDHRGDYGTYLDWEPANINLANTSAVEHADVIRELHAELLDFIKLKMVNC